MRKLLLLASCFIFLVLMTACSDKKDSDKYVFPLKLGNTWIMQSTFQGYDPNIQQDVTTIDTVYITVAAEIESPDGEPCFRVDYWSTLDPEHSIGYDILVNRADGLYQLGWKLGYNITPFKASNRNLSLSPFSFAMRSGASRDEVWLPTPWLLLPRNCEEGMEWTYGPNAHHLGAVYQIMPRVDVSVPNGNYTCHVRKTTLMELESNNVNFNYFAKDGPIKFFYEGVEIEVDYNGNTVAEHPYFFNMVLLDCHRN